MYNTIWEMQAAIKQRKISPTELTLQYLCRIAEVDSCNNGLNSVLEINPDALQIAQKLENKSNPLYGIPILLKDNIDTGDKMRTSAGSLALADNFARVDAPIVQNLRTAGAIIAGKANMTEFANFMAEGMQNGYSSRGGQTLHPTVLGCDPGGSSTGSAVAVAAKLCAASIGTETCGSIIGPAYSCGIVGIKPTAGLLNGTGIIPISNTLDTSGPMASNVTDAAIVLGVLQGKNDYARDLDSASLKTMRLGIYGKFAEDDEFYKARFEQVLMELEKCGAVVDRSSYELVCDSPWGKLGNDISVNEFMRCLEFYLSAATSKMKTLKNIIQFNMDNAQTCLRYGQSVLLSCLESSGRLIEPKYLKALHNRNSAAIDLLKVFDENKLDILLYAGGISAIAPVVGFPSGTIPIGIRENGEPIGLCLIARPFAEAELVRAMYAIERLFE